MEYTTLFKPSDTDSGEWPGQPQSQETFFENQGFIKAFAFNFLLLWKLIQETTWHLVLFQWWRLTGTYSDCSSLGV
jgi:hypothetical protein